MNDRSVLAAGLAGALLDGAWEPAAMRTRVIRATGRTRASGWMTGLVAEVVGAYRDAPRDTALSSRFGWDPGVAILSFEVLTRLSLGQFDSAAAILHVD